MNDGDTIGNAVVLNVVLILLERVLVVRDGLLIRVLRGPLDPRCFGDK